MNLRPKAWVLHVDPKETWWDEVRRSKWIRGRCACCERCWVMLGAAEASCAHGGPYDGYVDAG